MNVDPLFAQWLMDQALWSLREDAVRQARWGESAIVTERMTGIATLADAQAEGDRQLAFMGGPLAEDEHVVPIAPNGGWKQYLGQVITLTGPDMNYSAGLSVFLIAAEDNHATGLSTLTVLARL